MAASKVLGEETVRGGGSNAGVSGGQVDKQDTNGS